MGDSPLTGVLGRAVTSGPGPTPTSGTGVRGESGSGPGVFGLSASGSGVSGRSTSGSGTGVRAENTAGGFGLDVIGRARFSTCGSGVIGARQSSHAVANPAVTELSHITVTLTGNPGFPLCAVQWVQRQPGTGFVIEMTRPVINATTFTYLIVEPGA